jgi:signal transduction histidine kinase
MLKKPSYRELECEVKEIKDVLSVKSKEVGRLKSSILANISHEVRTPMNSIVGFSNLLTESRFSNEQKNFFISEINKNSKELLRLIDNILLAAQFESDSISINNRECNIASIFDDLFYYFNLKVKSNSKSKVRIKVIKPNDEKTRIIFTDVEKIKKVLHSLIENAIKYTAKGYVEFGYSIDRESNIGFFVKDTGIGINENDVEIIQTKFTQIDNKDFRNMNGIGLGLTIADKLIRILGGKLIVNSSLGQGSIFSFNLPLLVEKSV